MKMNEIIREKRIAKGLTQEQMATYLGVTAPAVNKWEKGNSYPDITMLSPLARLLETDLNTLMSFEEELSEQEIGNLVSEVYTVFTAHGIGEAFRMALDKVHKYPSCDNLILNMALTLEGIVTMYEKDGNGEYTEVLEELYVRASRGKDTQAANQAKAMLIFKYRNRSEFEKAEELLNELPEENRYHKTQIQAGLYAAQERWEDAARLTEQKMMMDISNVHSSLIFLMEILLKEKKTEQAEQVADVAGKMAGLFDLWEYTSYVASFELSVFQKDASKCISILEKMLPSLEKSWDFRKSPLYRHIPKKETQTDLGGSMLNKILQEFGDPNNNELDFLRNDPRFLRLIGDMKKEDAANA